MISIYCLVDPRTKAPFYVGASEKPKTRLNAHISRAKSWLDHARHIRDTGGLRWYPELQRVLTICDILEEGHKPESHILYECSPYCVQFYETFFYNTLMTQGFDLQQEIAKKYPSKKYEHPNKPKRKYHPIKNNLILIR